MKNALTFTRTERPVERPVEVILKATHGEWTITVTLPQQFSSGYIQCAHPTQGSFYGYGPRTGCGRLPIADGVERVFADVLHALAADGITDLRDEWQREYAARTTEAVEA